MSGNQENIEKRLTKIDHAIWLLTEKSLLTDERADDFDAKLSNLTTKLEALTDAQIRTEDSLARLSEAQGRMAAAQSRTEEALTHLAEAQARLADSQAHSDRRLDALIDIVQNWRNGGGGGGGGGGTVQP